MSHETRSEIDGMSYRATCSCGWIGGRRAEKLQAERDETEHKKAMGAEPADSPVGPL